jgi:RNA-directed DNA polymerase
VIFVLISSSPIPRRDPTLLDQKTVLAKLNRTMIGWANYFRLEPVSKAYRAVDQHARTRLRQWLCAKHKVWELGTKRFPDASLHQLLGLVCLTKRTNNFPWATS